MIRLKDVLNEMNKVDASKNPIPFSIDFVTCDRKRKTGGEIIHYDAAILSKKTSDTSNVVLGSSTKSPSHYENKTRNIKAIGSTQVRKLHIRLIIRFNNQTVIY